MSHQRPLPLGRPLLFLAIPYLIVQAACAPPQAKDGGLGPDPTEPVALTVTPPTATVAIQQAVQLRSYGRNGNGDSIAVPTDWSASGGSVTAAGVFSSGSAGSYVVRGAARSNGNLIDSAFVTVLASVVALRVTPAAASLATGATQNFAATLVSSDSSTGAVTPTWTATGGTINANGRYTAGSTAGTFRVIGRDATSGLADTSTVTVTASTAPITSVVVTPTTATVSTGGSVQFQAAGRRSDGSSASVTVNWSGSGGTINTSGRYTAGSSTGSFSVIAVQQGGTLADTSAVTVITPPPPPPPPPPGSQANPLLLPQPTGNGTPPGTAPALPAVGGGWNDAQSGVRVWRVSAGYHDYSNGPLQISLPTGNRYTVLVADGGYQLIDVTMGSGISNRRRLSIQPSGDICATFSYTDPDIIYVISGGTLYRVRLSTNAREDAPGFPMAGMGASPCWLMNSYDDRWFSTTSGGQLRVYDVQLGNISSRAKGGEAYLDRLGARVILTNEGSSSQPVWDVRANVTNTISLPSSHFTHGQTTLGAASTLNVDQGQGTMPLYTLDLETSTVSTSWIYPGYEPNFHTAGQWVQQGTPKLKQWILMGAESEQFANPGPCRLALCLFRLDGTDGVRHVAYHYSAGRDGYWGVPRATIGPDGHLVMWTSDLGGANSVYVAEVP
jgi:hypothetical protein